MTSGDEKLASYTGGLHQFRNLLRERWGELRDARDSPLRSLKRRTAEAALDAKERALRTLAVADDADDAEFEHIFRHKTRGEIIRISAAVMGIEFCYAAETAFVSPILLKIGVHHRVMTLIWCLSPSIGFFLTPILGSLSDRCTSRLGRRRPFILLLSIGLLLGLILVPNGRWLGEALGDTYPSTVESFVNETEIVSSVLVIDDDGSAEYNIENGEEEMPEERSESSHHPWGIFFTVLGTMLLDFDADACQSPARAYLLDVTIPEDHGTGLSTFTIMAGLGGSSGYVLGAINWDNNLIGWLFGGHVRAVFTLVLFIYIVCVLCTVTAFNEIPLNRVVATAKLFLKQDVSVAEAIPLETPVPVSDYGSMGVHGKDTSTNHIGASNSYNAAFATPLSGEEETSFSKKEPITVSRETERGPEPPQLYSQEEFREQVSDATLKQYLLSIIYMPKSLRILCLTNLFCWMSLVCYSLYFTDFVGEAVFRGDPEAPDGSEARDLYEQGVRFGCLGMALYSLSCSGYSFIIEKLVKHFGARPVYICSQLVYSLGMVCLAIHPSKASVIIFSCNAGVMYSTLFTMPYLLVAHYHATQTVGFERSQTVEKSKLCVKSSRDEQNKKQQIRGLGTDVAIVSSMVFLAQFIQALCMGSLITAVGSTVAIVEAAALLSFCGAVTATQVEYLDL